MRYLLDQLHSELLAGSLSTGEDTTIVSQIFGGTLQSDVQCLACCTDSRTHDPILDVSLDIPDRFISRRKGERQQDCKLIDCLTSYTGLETLEETEWYYCLRCKTREPSTKRLFLHTLPNVLCIHLKRFRFNSFVRTKISTPVLFPLSGLDMTQFTVAGREEGKRRRKGNIYDLAAVVVHHGSGVSSGHYTAYAFSPKSGLWYHFNDSTVTETTPKRVESCRAYILFYIRRDTSNGKYHHRNSDGSK
jgi:ubiquitin carboxyl-terminal hydrolase 3